MTAKNNENKSEVEKPKPVPKPKKVKVLKGYKIINPEQTVYGQQINGPEGHGKYLFFLGRGTIISPDNKDAEKIIEHFEKKGFKVEEIYKKGDD